KRIDLVIATRFPSYLIKHPNKVVWLIHQLRQAYDLLGTRYSDFAASQPRDARALEMIRAMDRRTLSEARAVYTISATVPARVPPIRSRPRCPIRRRSSTVSIIRGISETTSSRSAVSIP